MTRAIRNGSLAVVLLAACAGESSKQVHAKPWGTVELLESSTAGALRNVEYRDSSTGVRYRMRASVGEATTQSGWIESRAADDESQSVRIEWTETTVMVTATQGDGTEQFWSAGRARGLDAIDVDRLEQHESEDLPFLVRSATHADALLDSARLATPFAVARVLVAQGPAATTTTIAADAAPTFACDNTIDISGNCAVEAKLTRTSKQVFSVAAGTFLDKNTMDLSCGDQDGLVRVQACPLDAYNCDKFKNAKSESTLTASDPSDDTSNKNVACTILRSEGEGVDVGKKFEVKGSAEIRPGKPVRPKDPGDEAKSPLSCKLVWDLPEAPDWIYHQQWDDGHDTDKSHNKKFEVSLTAGTASGSLAIGGKTEITANVHTCQDSDVGRDDYAFSVRGTRSNQLYTCSTDTPPAPTACTTNDCGVVFVHGTSDQTEASARDDYWTKDTIDKIRNGKPYLIIGYPGGSKGAHETASWGGVIDQIGAWLAANTTVTNYVVVTHSNGVNPIRYALMHPTANTPGSRRVDTVTNKMRKVIAAAGSMTGTPLANSVTDARGLGQIANWVSTNFFASNWDVPAVWQQRTERMGTCGNGSTFPSGTCSGYNGDGTFGSPTDCYKAATTCGGKPVSTVVGSNVYAAVWSSDAWCGGYAATAALKATQCYGFGCSGCSDGFIGCDSQKYLGTKLKEDDRLNHNQSRRDCRGVLATIKNDITNTSWTSDPVPPDYTIAPDRQACRTAYRGTLDEGYASITFEGCPSTFRNNGTVDHDCYLAYGGDESALAVDKSPADGVLDGFAATSLATNTYYRAGATAGVKSGTCGPFNAPTRVSTTGCSATWKGDGWCDQCLVGKYGYDIKQGTATGADDCVTAAPGGSNKCFDMVWDAATSQTEYGSYVECR
jgi:hypothetical protein